jgi:hypothetical protein
MASLAQPADTRLQRRLPWALLLPAAAAFVAVLVQSLLVPVDCDVSWLITVNEKMLSGLIPYVDMVDPNPPASIWLYTPEIWIAHLLHLHPEAVIVGAFAAAALLSCAAVARMSAQLAAPPDPTVLIVAVSFVSLILPVGNFAQREHAALLLAIPALAGLSVLAEGRRLSLPARLAVGVAAGLVITIKPHFALAIAPAAAFAWARSRALRPLIAPALAAACTVALYGAALVLFTPQYLQLLPMFTAVYLSFHEAWPTLLRGPIVVAPLAIYALVVALRPRPLPALSAMLLIGSAGFALAGLVQMKGYLNHALPGMALGFVALVVAATAAGVKPARAKLVLGAAACLAALQLYAMSSIRPSARLAQTVERVAPPRPSMMALAPDLLTGHPLVRNVGGRWPGSRPSLFVAAGARQQLSTGPLDSRRQLLAWYRADLDAFAADVSRAHPDVILVDARPATHWLRAEPVIQRAMAGYRPSARDADIEVWVRR